MSDNGGDGVTQYTMKWQQSTDEQGVTTYTTYYEDGEDNQTIMTCACGCGAQLRINFDAGGYLNDWSKGDAVVIATKDKDGEESAVILQGGDLMLFRQRVAGIKEQHTDA